MDTGLIVTFCVLGALLIAGITTLIVLNSKNKKLSKVEDVKVVNGVRITKDNTVVTIDGNVKVTLNVGDVLLERGKEYVCQKGSDVIPGKYTLLSTDENTKSFNMRIGGIVREYQHFSSVVLTEGDKICAVSHAVILR